MLHARELGFYHPKLEKRMTFKAPFPKDFADLLVALEPYRD
jgi:hypothetical protein